MKRGSTFRALAAATLILLLIALPAAAGRRDEPFESRTRHYIVRTDISLRFTDIVSRHMEEIFKDYSRRFADFGEATRRFEVFVFRREPEYWQHVPRQVKGSTGVFISAKKLLAAHADGRNTEEVLRTLYHEGFHQFMYEVISHDCPVWLNEGLAEYFSEATWDGRQFVLGAVPTARLHTVQEAVREGSYISFLDLFSMDTEAWLQNVRQDARRASLIYSQSWSIIHFLAHGDGGRHAEQLNALLRAVADGADGQEALKQALGPNLDLSRFESAWARHLLTLRPSPKFRCRTDMKALMVLAETLYRDPRRFRSVSDLRRKALNTPGLRWEIQRSDGKNISSEDRNQAAKLFRCPYDRSRHGISYTVVEDPRTGLPVMVCPHHPGLIVKAYFRGSGSRRVVEVEEEVRELADPAFKQAIRASMH